MRVLLAARHPPQGRLKIGGVQSWAATVAKELHRRKIMVECWGPELPVPAGRFDLGILANVGDTRRVLTICNRSLAISHGIIDAEKPDAACDLTAFVSENVRDHWGLDGPIIRQPIDLEFWKPIVQWQQSFLTRYSYRAGQFHGHAVADGMKVPYLHLKDVGHLTARAVMWSSLCVYATGRGALESAACGVPVVIYDHRVSYQGPLLAEFDGQMEKSYSGRGGIEPDLSDVVEATERAIERGSLRAHVEEYHDSRKVVEQMLCLMC